MDETPRMPQDALPPVPAPVTRDDRLEGTPALASARLVLLPGDIGLNHAPTWLGTAIGWFESLRDNKPAFATHAWMSAGGGDIIEEGPLGIREAKLSQYVNTPMHVYRSLVWTDAQKVAMVALARAHIGEWYGYGKLPLFALDNLFHTYWFTQHVGLGHWKVCSQFLAWEAYHVVGGDVFGAPWRSTSPDIIDDWCASKKTDWLRMI